MKTLFRCIHKYSRLQAINAPIEELSTQVMIIILSFDIAPFPYKHFFFFQNFFYSFTCKKQFTAQAKVRGILSAEYIYIYKYIDNSLNITSVLGLHISDVIEINQKVILFLKLSSMTFDVLPVLFLIIKCFHLSI